MFEDGSRALDNFAYNAFTITVVLVPGRSRLPMGHLHVLNSPYKLRGGISPHILGARFAEELNECTVCLVSLLGGKGKAILVVAVSVNNG